jgi:hypothetical protein
MKLKIKQIIWFFKILKMIKEKQKEKTFLTEYLAFCIGKQNEYIKINDAKSLEVYNYAVDKTLGKIDILDGIIHELKRDARLVR